MTTPDKPEKKDRRYRFPVALHPKHAAMLRQIKIRMIDDQQSRRPVGNQSAVIYCIERVAGETEG